MEVETAGVTNQSKWLTGKPKYTDSTGEVRKDTCAGCVLLAPGCTFRRLSLDLCAQIYIKFRDQSSLRGDFKEFTREHKWRKIPAPGEAESASAVPTDW